MTEEQLKTLQEWVKALVDEKIEQAFGRDAGNEWLARMDVEDKLKDMFR